MDVLVPLFEQETGYDLKPIYNGSRRCIIGTFSCCRSHIYGPG
jgi:hypothetical protein